MSFPKLSWAVLLVVWTACTSADFTVYKAYNADALVAGLALGETCLQALLDAYGRYATLLSYLHRVSRAWERGANKGLPLTFAYNAGLVCTRDQAASRWCFLDSQTWQGSDYIRWDPDMCFSNGDDNSTVAPECADPGFDVDEVDDDMSAIRNLYEKDLIYRKRLLNPWLPNANFTDYLIDRFDGIQRVCSTSLPYTTSASTLYAVEATSTTTTGATPTSQSMTATPTCQGQTIQPLENWLTCNDLSDT
ncbi:lysM domain-containing protein [Colletotrichum spaethianum]|uniref:LysM domain-containing protein n=1 Tax=Colletotrichum spaethianum TaxID=700344 RepID=A0AA37LCS4_9PEZI|nr:lysM domain-containing protein [Colletotrichum spaethianum]GKT43585.1 lysM domain-containing protein [Colletotrichum spaethianum]